jgi:hypothetical protein
MKAQDSGPASSGEADKADFVTEPVDIAIVVDESGSITPTQMDQERYAAALIALGEFSTESRVTVLGFGSVGEAKKSPVDHVCPIIKVNNAANRQALSTCIGNLRPRTDAEGNDTDFVSAINQGVSALQRGGDPKHRKLLFLLTDGKLEVSTDPAYGADVSARNAKAQQLLDDSVLPGARAAGVQIWPLGFGAADEGQLRSFAVGGAQNACGSLPSAVPHATLARDARDVTTAMFEAYAGARCARVSPGGAPQTLDAGAALDLSVTVPPVATDGAIEVIRQDPRIRVTYFDPRGRQVPTSGALGESTFELSGTGGPVEALRMTNPAPGTWRVRLEAPPGLASRLVSATVLWQSIVRAVAIVSPPQPVPGEHVTVTARLATRTRLLTSSAGLEEVVVRATLTGDGITAPGTAALNDRGAAPDRRAGDGEYAATLAVPRTATGALSFVVPVEGPGIVGDERVVYTSVPPQAAAVHGQITLDSGEASPGSTVGGTVLLTNNTSADRQVRLLLRDTPPAALASVRPAIVAVPASGTISVPVMVAFGAQAKLGFVPGQLVAVDDANPQNPPYANVFLNITLVRPQTLLERFLWAWISLVVLALAALAALVLRRARRRAARDVRGLTLELYRGEQRVHRLRAPPMPGTAFPFVIRGLNGATPRFDVPGPGDTPYVASRGPDGVGVRVRRPEGDTLPLVMGRPMGLADGLSIDYHDDRYSGLPGNHPRAQRARGAEPASARPPHRDLAADNDQRRDRDLGREEELADESDAPPTSATSRRGRERRREIPDHLRPPPTYDDEFF